MEIRKVFLISRSLVDVVLAILSMLWLCFLIFGITPWTTTDAIDVGEVDTHVTGIAWHERMHYLDLHVENPTNYNRVTYAFGGWLKL